MLTIKHIDTDGSERIMEAERIKVVLNKGLGDDGIFLDPVEPIPNDAPCANETPSIVSPERPFLGFKAVIHPPRSRSVNDVNPMVFVMNRFGATVATYRL